MVELRPSEDLVADPSGHPALGWPENIDRWLGRNRDLAALDGPRAYRVFMTIAEFPAVRASHLRHIVGGASAEVRLSRVNYICRFGVNQFCRFTSSAWPRCWAASVR